MTSIETTLFSAMVQGARKGAQVYSESYKDGSTAVWYDVATHIVKVCYDKESRPESLRLVGKPEIYFPPSCSI